MLRAIMDALGPEEIYRIARVESAAQLRSLISQNNNEDGLSLDDYEGLLTKELCLIEGYEYLKKRSREWNFTQSRANDYNNRVADFAECLERANAGRKDLPNRRFDSQNYGCFFNSSQRYQNKRDHFQNASASTTAAFFKFLQQEKGAVATELRKKMPEKKAEVVRAVARPTPSAPLAEGERGEGVLLLFRKG